MNKFYEFAVTVQQAVLAVDPAAIVTARAYNEMAHTGFIHITTSTEALVDTVIDTLRTQFPELDDIYRTRNIVAYYDVVA